MKKIIYLFFVPVFTFAFLACEMDNYDEPNATIQGRILEPNGQPMQTEQGAGNMRIEMMDLSWGEKNPDAPVLPTYLNMKQDGSYINTKIFAGKFRMTPIEGPFYPYDREGEVVNIKGTTTQDFTVTPYLNVEWVSKPTATVDNKITCSIKFTRNAKDGETMPNLLNARLCIATTQYVGNNNKDDQVNGGAVTVTNDQEGQVITFTSNKVKYSTTYYVRVGVCCNDNYKKYNYTDIQMVTVN